MRPRLHMAQKWANFIPPIAHRLVTNVVAPFMKKVFDIAKRKRKPDIHGYNQSDDFGRSFKMAKRVLFYLTRRLVSKQIPIKQFSSSKAVHLNIP